MDVTSGFEALVAGLLLFVLPGLTGARALFPEWRFRGPMGPTRAVETLVLAFVLSVAFTIVLGDLLLEAAPGGFSASWSDPLLEVVLTAVTVLGFVAALARGAFRHEPPVGPALEPASGADDGWPLVARMEAIDRERRRLRHLLRAGASATADRDRWRATLVQLDAEADRIRGARETEYAR